MTDDTVPIPFEYNLKDLAKGCYNPVLRGTNELRIEPDIEKNIERLKQRMQAELGLQNNRLAQTELLLDLLQEGNPLQSALLQRVGYLIDKGDPLLETWSDEDKRYLLDCAVSREVEFIESWLKRRERVRSIYGVQTDDAQEETPKSQLEAFKKLQQEIRQRAF
jgi:hypothetical protein